MNPVWNIARAALVLAVTIAVALGCSPPKDTVAGSARAAATLPSVEETKAIAEEAYIYGLPLVMNYAVMYDFAVNRDSGQFKAPFNEIANEARVFTYKDTAVIVPNSDTPYSTVSLDLRAEPMVLSVPAVEKGRYYSVQLCDGNTFNYGYIGSRATGNDPGDYLVAGPDGQARRRLASGRCSGRRRSSRWPSSAPSSSAPRTCRTCRRCSPATGCGRSRLISGSLLRRPHPGSTSRRSTSRSS